MCDSRFGDALRLCRDSCRTFGAYQKTHNAKTTPLRTWLFHFGPSGLGARSHSHRLSLCFSRLPLLLFDELFPIAVQPALQISRRLFQLVIVQQAAAQRFKERARAHVVGEFLVSFV